MQPDYIEQIARVTHEANRAIQIIQGDPSVSPPWDEAPEWQRVSAKDGVRKAIQGATAEELHDNWSRFKESDGWVYGEVKDEVAKTHPCLVPYDQLPADQRLKDYVFGSIVTGYIRGVALDANPGQSLLTRVLSEALNDDGKTYRYTHDEVRRIIDKEPLFLDMSENETGEATDGDYPTEGDTGEVGYATATLESVPVDSTTYIYNAPVTNNYYSNYNEPSPVFNQKIEAPQLPAMEPPYTEGHGLLQ